MRLSKYLEITRAFCKAIGIGKEQAFGLGIFQAHAL
jgi:hypothetical protein